MALMPLFFTGVGGAGGKRMAAAEDGGAGIAGEAAGRGRGAGICIVMPAEIEVVIPATTRRLTSSYCDLLTTPFAVGINDPDPVDSVLIR